MLNHLYIINFPSTIAVDVSNRPWPFVLKTCQRTLMAAWGEEHLQKLAQIPGLNSPLKSEIQVAHGVEAYLYLLETICGLKSRLLAENEIVGQFKEAYQEFLESKERETKLMLILEKLFKDAKEIRGRYLIGIGQKTYASLTRKHLLSKGVTGPVCIVGSGELALDLIHQLKKKRPLILCARNQEKVKEWQLQHDLKVIPWDEREQLATYPLIANTIGDEQILFDQGFFHNWSQHHSVGSRIFVDLGHPSVVDSPLEKEQGLIRLTHILQEGAIRDEQKLQQIDKAKEAMDELIEHRIRIFEKKWGQSTTTTELGLV